MASPKPKKPVAKKPKSLNDFLKAGKKPPVKLKPGLKPGPDGMDVKLPRKTR